MSAPGVQRRTGAPATDAVGHGPLTPALTVMVVIGGAAIVVGGLVAAVTDPLGWAVGSWAAAYLVLVAGAAQVAYGLLQRPLARTAPSTGMVTWQLVLFNLGNAAVIIGTVVDTPAIVYVGSGLLVIALVLFLAAVRHRTAAHPLAVWTYRAITAILLVSIPIGSVLSTLRH